MLKERIKITLPLATYSQIVVEDIDVKWLMAMRRFFLDMLKLQLLVGVYCLTITMVLDYVGKL